MPDLNVLRKTHARVPKMNASICEGLAVEEMKGCEEYIDRVMSCAAECFPPGLVYTGYKRVTPRAQFAEMTRPRNNKRSFEVTRSDMYMTRFNFAFEGKALKPRYLMMPYVNRGGIIKIRDSKFVISPTLVDNLFSVEDEKVYMPVTRSKLTFFRHPYYFIANDQTITTDIYWSKLHYSRKDEAAKTKFPQLVNYLFCHHGVTGTFKKYFDTDVVIGNTNTITEEQYPATDWVICQTKGIKPKTRGFTGDITNVRLAIPIEKFTKTIKSVVASFYHILDNTTYLPFMVDEYMDDVSVWKRALARFIWKDVVERQACQQIDGHLRSISHYLDELVLRKFRYEGIEVDNILSLFVYIIENFPRMTIENNVAGTHGKFLSVVPNVMFNAVKMIFNLMFELDRLEGAKLRMDSINRLFDRNFKQIVMMSIPTTNPEVTTLESATDCLVYKTTSQIVTHSKAGSKSKSAEMNNPAFLLDPEQCTAHSILMISKSSPSARGRIQPFIETDKHGKIIPNPRLAPLRDNLRELM